MKTFYLSVCLFTAFTLLFNTVVAQQLKSAAGNDPVISLKKALKQIGAYYEVNFTYEEGNIRDKKVSFNIKTLAIKKLDQILNELLTPAKLSWSDIDSKNYSIFPVKDKKQLVKPGRQLLGLVSTDTIVTDLATAVSVTAQKAPEVLNEVKVTASRPVIIKKADRFILNMEDNPMASGNSIQLLKTAPFVEVSPDNEVSLQGKKTMILINHKPVAGASLNDILQTLPANTISQIELITNPSSKYDAAYGAVINIITRKNQVEGTTATLRAEGSQGDFGRLNVNGNLTYKHNKLTLFGMAGYNRFNFQTHDQLHRRLSAVSPADLIDEEITRTFFQDIYNFQGGVNLQTGKNQNVVFLIDGQTNHTKGTFNSIDRFSKTGAPVDSILYTNSPFTNKPFNYNYNLTYNFNGDSAKNELQFLATFTPVKRTLEQYFPAVLLNLAGDTLSVSNPYKTLNRHSFNILVAQLDYSHAFNKQWKLESGLKYQYTDAKQVIDFQEEKDGQLIKNTGNSSDSHLTEVIMGAYGIISKDWDKNKLKLGIRLEHTKASYVGYYTQSYLKAFPNLFYQHLFDEANDISFSYKSTISRGPYDELVPYTLYINQYTIFKGNPMLQPQYDYILSLNTRLHKLNIMLTYTAGKGAFAQFPVSQDQNTRVTYFALQNLDKSANFTVDVSYPVQIKPWWTTQNTGTVFGWSTATGQVLEQPFTLSGSWFSVKSNHLFTLSSIVKLELDGYYRSAKKTELAYFGSNGNMNAGLLINLFKSTAQVRIRAEEIFQRNVYHTSQNFTVYGMQRDRYFDSRRISLGLTYNLGRSKVKTPVKKLGNEEAVDRL